MSFNTSLHREDNLPDDFIFQDSDDHQRIYLDSDFTLFLKHNIKVYEGLMYMLHEHSWEISCSIIVLVHAISNKPLFMETDSYVSGALHNFFSSRTAKVPVGHDDDSVWWYDGSKSWFKMMDNEDEDGNDANEMFDQPPVEVCMDHPNYDSTEWQW